MIWLWGKHICVCVVVRCCRGHRHGRLCVLVSTKRKNISILIFLSSIFKYNKSVSHLDNPRPLLVRKRLLLFCSSFDRSVCLPFLSIFGGLQLPDCLFYRLINALLYTFFLNYLLICNPKCLWWIFLRIRMFISCRLLSIIHLSHFSIFITVYDLYSMHMHVFSWQIYLHGII